MIDEVDLSLLNKKMQAFQVQIFGVYAANNFPLSWNQHFHNC